MSCVGRAGRRDRSSMVCRPDVRSVGSGSATRIPSMQRPALSTAMAVRASSCSVAVPAATARTVASVTVASPRLGCPRSRTMMWIDRSIAVPSGNLRRIGLAGLQHHGQWRWPPIGCRTFVTDHGHEVGCDSR